MALSRFIRGPVLTPTQDIVDGVATYSSVFAGSASSFGGTAGPTALSATFAAAGRKQYATIYHTVGSQKELRLREVLVAVAASSAAVQIDADVVQLNAATAPAGGTQITPVSTDPTDPAGEAVCRALPSTPGSELGVFGKTNWNIGVTGAGATAPPPGPIGWVTLYAATIDEQKPVMLPAGVAGGFAVVLQSSGPATIQAYAMFVFTEE